MLEDEVFVPVINSSENEFTKKVTPIKLTSAEELFLFSCPECSGVHFRHAGYFEMMMPFMRADKSKNVATESYQVKVCVACRKAYVWAGEQMYDVTDLIDLEAWEKFEKVAQKATGPGGQC